MKLTARPVIALALCAGLAGVTGLTSASAAPKPVCNLVTDVKGDAKGPTAAVNEPALDILSADVASNAKKITGVIRVLKLAETTANYPLGITWRVNFTIGDTSYGMYAISDRSGVVGQTSFTDPTTGSGTIAQTATTAVLDMVKNEVRISTSTTAFAGRVNVKPGTKLEALDAVTGGIFQFATPAVSGNLRYASVDDTTGGSDYTAGTASCVTPGK